MRKDHSLETETSAPLRRSLTPTKTATALALVLALAACANSGPTPEESQNHDRSATLLKIADDTRAGGDFMTAETLYRQLHDADPKDPVPLTRLGATLMLTQHYAGAAGAWRAALLLAPDDADSHRGLALALLADGKPEQAMAELRPALAKGNDDPRLYNALGIAHDMLGRHDLAQQDYRRGLALAPGNIGLRNNYGMSLALAGDYAEAITTLSIIANAPDASPRYRLNLALAYGLAGDQTRAAATARDVLDEHAVQSNLASYAALRTMDEKERTAAILGLELRGAPLPKLASAAPAAAPVGHVDAAPLPSPDRAPAPAPSQVASDLAVKPASAAPSQATPTAASEEPISAPVELAKADTSGTTPAPAAPVPLVKTAAPTLAAAAAPVSPPAAPATVAAADPAGQMEAAPWAVAPIPAAPGKTPSGAAAASDVPTATSPMPAALPKPAAAPAAASPEPAEQAGAAPSAGAVPAGSEPHAVAQIAAAPSQPAVAPHDHTARHPAGAMAERFVVQLGSFSVEALAQKLVDRFAAKGITLAMIRNVDREKRVWFVVRTAEITSADEAKTVLGQVRAVGGVEPAILRVSASAMPAASAEPANTTSVAAAPTPSHASE